MSSFMCQESEILLVKNREQFNETLELALLNEEEHDFYIESIRDIGTKMKSLFQRFVNALSVYANNTVRIISLYNDKRNVNNNIKVIKKLIKKNPKLGKKKIKYRLFSDYKDNLDFDIKICNNIAYRIEKLDEPWITNLMDSYYKNIDSHDKNIHDVTISDALSNCEAVVSDIDKEIDKIVKSTKDIVSKLDKSENINENHLGIFKRFIKSIQTYIQTKTHMLILNVEFLFSNIHNVLKSSVEDAINTVVIKRQYKYETIEKHATKVDTVDVLGFKIDLYETDRYIESEFTTGFKSPRVYFDKSFKKMPRASQEAILYHEYGHIINGHLGTVHYRDEYKLDKKIRRRVRKYLRFVDTDKNKLKDDDLLLYLLVELEADEFSAKYVGKTVIRKTLEHDYKELIKKVPNMSEEEKDNTLAIGFIRNKML